MADAAPITTREWRPEELARLHWEWWELYYLTRPRPASDSPPPPATRTASPPAE